MAKKKRAKRSEAVLKVKKKGKKMETQTADTGRESSMKKAGRTKTTEEMKAKFRKIHQIHQEQPDKSYVQLAQKHEVSYQTLLGYLKKEGLYETKVRSADKTSFEFKKNQRPQETLLYPHTKLFLSFKVLDSILKASLDVGLPRAVKDSIADGKIVIVNIND